MELLASGPNVPLMGRRFVIIAISILSVGVILFDAFYFKDTTIKTVPKTEESFVHIRMARPYWPGFAITPLSDELGYMKEEGIIMDFLDLPDDVDTYVSMKNNELDVRGALASDYLSVVRESKIIDSKIVIITDYSNGGDALIKRKGAPSLSSDVKKRLSGANDYSFFVPYALDALNASTSSIEYVEHANDFERITKLNAGEIDYAVTYEPFLTKAIDGGAEVVFSSADQKGLLTDVLLFSSKFIEENPGVVEKFARAYFKAYKYWQENPIESYNKVSKYYGYKPDEFFSQMKGIILLGLNDNVSAMSVGLGLTSIYGNLQMAQMYELSTKGGESIDVSKIIYDGSVRMMNDLVQPQALK